MADNVAITAGTGTTIAADEVVDTTLGTVKVQIMKIMDGTLNSTNKLIVDSTGSAQVSLGPSGVVDRSGFTSSTAGVATNFAPANAVRKGFLVQSFSNSDLWIDMVTVATNSLPSIRIPPMSYFECPQGAQGTGALSIYSDLTSQAFTAKEW